MFISGSLCVFCQQQSTFTRIGWFMHWQQGVALPLFTNFFGQKTEINHAVENLAKIWHHMWHWGHKCNCFGDLSLIVEGSQLYCIVRDFLRYPQIKFTHFSATSLCIVPIFACDCDSLMYTWVRKHIMFARAYKKCYQSESVLFIS